MSRIYDKAFRLYIENVSGHLTAEDKALLKKELATDEAFRRIWDELDREGSGVKEFLKGTDPAAELELLKQRVRLPLVSASGVPGSDAVGNTVPAGASVGGADGYAGEGGDGILSGGGVIRKMSFARKSIAAAIFLLLAGSTGYLIFSRNTRITNKEKIAAIVLHNKQAISLTLNNGKSITLFKDSVRRTIVSDNATLLAGDGTLKYRSEDTTQNTLFIPAGEDYRIVLSDGTEVMLNATTKLRFPFNFSGRSRVVYLEGEAYFKVAKDAQRPFIVQTPLTQVQVLGTSFNVNTYTPGNVATSLVEGKVIMHGGNGAHGSNDKDIELKPGYAANFQAASGFSLSKFDEGDVLSWMSGTYYFHNTPVDKLTDIIYRCYGVNIVIDKEKLAKKSVTGLMDRKKLTEFLSDLETTAQIKYYYSGNQLRLE